MTTRQHCIWLAAAVWLWSGVAAAQTGPRPVETIPGMPPVVNPTNLYSEIRPDNVSPTVSGALSPAFRPVRKSLLIVKSLSPFHNRRRHNFRW